MSELDRAEALRRADWDVLAHRLLDGVRHDINGRAAALSAIAHMCEMYAEPPSAEMLHQESRRLEKIVGLMSLLQGELDSDPEAIAVGEHIPGLVEMSSRGHALDRVKMHIDADDSAPPILVNRCLFFRSFLLVLDEISTVACAIGSKRVRVEFSPKGNGLHLGVVALPTETDTVEPVEGSGHLESLGRKLAWVAGALASTDASVSIRESAGEALAADFWFPSLSMARRPTQPTDRAKAGYETDPSGGSIELAAQRADADPQ